MSSAERRRHVRVKPTPELPARAVLASDGPVREAIDVVDVSASGLALSSSRLATVATGSRLDLRLSLDRYGDHDLRVDVRWKAGELVGVEVVEPTDEAAQAIRRYVGELLERGGAS
ncbi:hypothetical protein AKJ09_03478 [Labilithrix luteola]|uniref:PilZ domain-containing protein n=1 Tax=Labilithrix luteola TaxID=1391654 RepID=A0A0K1PUK3_9BACT|nr:PilZ domain-containing protein [Labilithrix luteola]AKU96814.1 hypothetical protein AKJ09_03478 [Labilithrix luteola]